MALLNKPVLDKTNGEVRNPRTVARRRRQTGSVSGSAAANELITIK
jgi:hypothetical protein